jgi:hypothetical protein
MLERKKNSKKPPRSGRSVTRRLTRGGHACDQRRMHVRGRSGKPVDPRVGAPQGHPRPQAVVSAASSARADDALALAAGLTRFHGRPCESPGSQPAENSGDYTMADLT